MSYNDLSSSDDKVIAVPLSLKMHFDAEGFGPDLEQGSVVYVDPSDPGHDFLNPESESDSAKKGVWARVSAALRQGRA